VEHKGGEPQQLSKIQILHDIMQKLSENRSCQKKVLTAANPLLFLDAAVIGGRLLIFFFVKNCGFYSRAASIRENMVYASRCASAGTERNLE